MAHRGRNTGCCQFFIVHDPQPHLDGVHTVFGMVTDNMGAVRNMRNGDRMVKVEIIEK
jgi:peptidyl-prolyl cis-trans isomerase B (cyclophilin B)